MRRTTIRRPRVLAFVLLIAVVAAAVALTACGGDGDAAGQSVENTPASQRVVLVAPGGPVEPSIPGGVIRAWLLSGKIPPKAVEARVLTDEECEPDAAGISRCLNRLLMPSGETLVVRHPHDMSTVPCLSPGEKVRVVATNV